jgi:enoyl-CoA hydratase/carnithine racemase
MGTRMFVPASRIGLAYYPGGLRRFTARLGPAAAKKIFLTSMPLPAEEMLRIGFLQDLVAPADLAAAVDRYVEALVAADAGAVASMKRSIDRLAGGDGDEHAARRDYDASLGSAELRRRLRDME